MKKSVLISILFIILLSCNKSTNQELNNYSKDNSSSNEVAFNYKIDRERALEIAKEAPERFSNENITKSNNRKVLECVPITSNSTTTKGTSLSLDTLMYVLNYANDMGYIFVSTDERTGDVIAFIEKGNFNIQDTSKSKLTNFLVSLMLNYQKTLLSELQKTTNSNKATKGIVGGDRTYAAYLRNPQGPLCNQVLRSDCNYGPPGICPYEAQIQGDTYYKNKGCIATREFRDPDIYIGPLLTTQWDQGSPFNNNAPLIGTNKAAAGCTAIATAQLMVYHNYPKNYPSDINNGSYTYISSLRKEKLWTDFTSSASKNSVATFVRTVGDLIKNTWGYPSTGGSQYNITSCLSKMGYKNISQVIDYDNTAVLNSLANLRPVIAIGYRQENTEGHTWVIDGRRTSSTGYDNYYFDEYGNFNGSKFGAYRDNQMTHIHCNFGWRDSGNDGYYVNGIFCTPNMGYYKYRLQIIPNIHK